MTGLGPLLNPVEGLEVTMHEDGKKCFVFPRQRCGSWSKQQVIRWDGREYAVAYLQYTWSWYLFDMETGEEVISAVSTQYYERHFAKHKLYDLVTAKEGEC